MTTVPPLVRVTRVEPRDGFVLHVWFDDGSEKEIDVEWLLRGPIFDPIRNDPKLFSQVRVDGGTAAWPNGADIDPVVLHGSAMPAWFKPGDSETAAG
ncbi:MAG: DUF2442 domain-containing protein [Actinomycetota bacterium]